MKSLKLLILVFAFGLSLPLAYLVFQAYRSLESEEAATLSYFAETLFDEMQATAAAVIRREESRPIDAYRPADAFTPSSPLSGPPAEVYIRGYFQNNPDGSFQTPFAPASEMTSADPAARRSELEEANRVFNRKRAEKTDRLRTETVEADREEKRKDQVRFAEKYLDLSRSQRSKSYLGERETRLERVTPEQALNIQNLEKKHAGPEPGFADAAPKPDRRAAAAQEAAAKAAAAPAASRPSEAGRGGEKAEFQAEVAPFQSVFIDDGRVYVFRRILIDDQLYRQGFVLEIDAFFAHLIRTHFSPQPMARFTRLQLRALDNGRQARGMEAGPAVDLPRMIQNRTFPPPFSFLKATLSCENIPPSEARGSLDLALAGLAGVMLLGLLAIYHSARKIVDFSERQSRFVSSVTHELKTPLTNIRMYIEMLEQGMARDPEAEQRYFRVLQTEGARLSRLITNVLELSKLERKHRRPNLQPGTFDEVIADVENLMGEGLKQEGFSLKVENTLSRPFRYDREIMVQILINLIENSVKFGKSCESKEITIRSYEAGERVHIAVADTGLGIPHGDLKKVFNDFYRADSAVTSAAGGTGIGLALVRRFVAMLGGDVFAANNRGAGCTITIRLPQN